MSLTGALVESVIDLTPETIPQAAKAVARHCILDWFAVALAGAREPLSDILVAEVASGDAGGGTLVGRDERAGLLACALINGSASHALDFDDTHTLMSGHPSVPVLPAALALAERDGSDGAAFLAAVVAGIETECRLGAIVNPGHYAAGFHATGTLGTFGAAAAAAHLLRLDAARWRHALALAGTQAAGLKASFGTMAKPLHAGRAASNGLLAALLARGGFTGNPEVFDTAQGFAATHHAPPLDAGRIDQLRGRFLITDTLFKYHASCYLTHAAIDAAAWLRADGAFAAAGIESVEVRASDGCVGVCDIPVPATGLEAKFSLRATTAMALLGDDTSDPAAFNDGRTRDAAFRDMLDRVRFVPIDDLPATRATVVVIADGREFTADADTGRPEPDLERQSARLGAKFFALATPVLGAERAGVLHDALGRIDEAPSMAAIAALARAAAPVEAR